MSQIECRREQTTGRVTLRRAEALNALTHAMCDELEAALLDWQQDDTITQVVIDAEGEKAFCAGGDIAALYHKGRAGAFDDVQAFWREEYRLNSLIHNYPKPYIAFLQGYVMGGGVGISCHGSHRIVGETTKMANVRSVWFRMWVAVIFWLGPRGRAAACWASRATGWVRLMRSGPGLLTALFPRTAGQTLSAH